MNFKVFHTVAVLKLHVVNVHKLNEENCKNGASDQGVTVLISSLMPAFTERRPPRRVALSGSDQSGPIDLAAER